MSIRSKKKVYRIVTNKKNKSKRGKSKKQRTRKQNIRKQRGGDEKFKHGSICNKNTDPKFIYVFNTYQKGSNTRTGGPKVLICKKSLKMPFTKRKRSSTLPKERQKICLDQPCYHVLSKLDKIGKNKKMIKKIKLEGMRKYVLEQLYIIYESNEQIIDKKQKGNKIIEELQKMRAQIVIEIQNIKNPNYKLVRDITNIIHQLKKIEKYDEKFINIFLEDNPGILTYLNILLIELNKIGYLTILERDRLPSFFN